MSPNLLRFGYTELPWQFLKSLAFFFVITEFVAPVSQMPDVSATEPVIGSLMETDVTIQFFSLSFLCVSA